MSLIAGKISDSILQKNLDLIESSRKVREAFSSLPLRSLRPLRLKKSKISELKC